MTITAETNDSIAVSDADLEDMANLCSQSPNAFAKSVLMNQTSNWVLLTLARDEEHTRGFSFFSLERIGGTPCCLIGATHICRNNKRDSILSTILNDQLRRAVLAFPDEDVLLGTQINDPGALDAYRTLDNIIPRPNHNASGEERAWGRRLAKRFGIGPSRYEDRVFTARGKGHQSIVFDHASAKPSSIAPEVQAQFGDLNVPAGDTLIVFGWALLEDLEKLL